MSMKGTVSREAVFAAAEQLSSRGENPTQQKVRDLLGGGSYSTIGPLMREWEAAQAQKVEARKSDMPEAVRRAVEEAAGTMWGIAKREAFLGVEAAQRELQDLKNKADLAQKEYQSIVEIVEGERDEAQKERDEAQKLLAELRASFDELSKTAEQRARENWDLSQRNVYMQERNQELIDEKGALQRQVEILNEQLTNTSAHVKKLDEDLTGARARVDALRDQQEKWQIEASKAEADLVVAKAKYEAEAQKLKEQLELAEGRVEFEKSQVRTLEHELSQLAVRDETIAQLTAELAARSKELSELKASRDPEDKPDPAVEPDPELEVSAKAPAKTERTKKVAT